MGIYVLTCQASKHSGSIVINTVIYIDGAWKKIIYLTPGSYQIEMGRFK